MTTTRPWLVAYDIRAPKRLRKVQKRLAQQGFAIQYSLYALDLTDAEQKSLLKDLSAIALRKEDDIRLYPLSRQLHGFARGPFLYEREGISAMGSEVLKLLEDLRRQTPNPPEAK